MMILKQMVQNPISGMYEPSHNLFLFTPKGHLVLWQDLVSGDLTGDQFLHWSKVAHPRDSAAEK